MRYREAEAALFADAGIEPVERWIDVETSGTKARVLEVGSGVPTVFFTGGPMAAATWAYCVRNVSGRRCLLIERPGTGVSDAPADLPDVEGFPPYLTGLVRDVLDGLELGSAALVGSSLGGCIALRSAAAMPERVSQVVLVGCPAFVPGWRQPAFFDLLRTPILGRLVLRAPATRASVRMALRQLGHAGSLAAGRIPRAMLEWERAWQRHTDTMRNDGQMIRGLGTWRGGFDERLDLTRADLASVGAPCLVLVGTDDPVGGEAVGRSLAGALPDGRVEVLEGFGHLPWLDDPERVGRAISGFGTEG